VILYCFLHIFCKILYNVTTKLQLFVIANRVPEEQDAVKNKEPVAQNKIYSSKSYIDRNPKPLLVRKQSGIQLKGGSIFCLPERSSHSSRIIIPNKRFLEGDYKVEISPKKLKVEPLSADAKKESSITVLSSYKCQLGAKKQLKSDSALNVVCKPDIETEPGLCKSESAQIKENKSDVDKQDIKLDISDKLETMTAQAVDGESLKNKFTIDSTSLMSSSDALALTGSILQRPKLCLDQTAVDRSKLAFADSLRNQIAQESQPDTSDVRDVKDCASSVPATEDAVNSEVCSITTSAPCSNSMASVTCRNWNSSTGKCQTLYCFLYSKNAL